MAAHEGILPHQLSPHWARQWGAGSLRGRGCSASNSTALGAMDPGCRAAALSGKCKENLTILSK